MDTLFKKQATHFIFNYNLIKFKFQYYSILGNNIEIPLVGIKSIKTFIQFELRSLDFIPNDELKL